MLTINLIIVNASTLGLMYGVTNDAVNQATAMSMKKEDKAFL